MDTMKVYPTDSLMEYAWKDGHPNNRRFDSDEDETRVPMTMVKSMLRDKGHDKEVHEHVDGLSTDRALEAGVHNELLVKRNVIMDEVLDLAKVPERMRKLFLENEKYGHAAYRHRFFSSRPVTRT